MCILIQFESTSYLQFGFKKGVSTTPCSGVLKNAASPYSHRGSSVFAFFFDSSKIDLVRQKLVDRGLPCLVRFLSFWYSERHLRVRWGANLARSFGVFYGVRQGGVLSPILFLMYVLLVEGP